MIPRGRFVFLVSLPFPARQLASGVAAASRSLSRSEIAAAKW